jgi:hypothetical protein
LKNYSLLEDIWARDFERMKDSPDRIFDHDELSICMTFGKHINDELTKKNIAIMDNFFSIYRQNLVIQNVKQIDYILEFLDQEEGDKIEKELEERYQEEIGILKINHNPILISDYFEKRTIYSPTYF